MSVFKQKYPASFRGVPFLVNTETKSGGKKVVSHEYVNNDERFVEELGKLPPSFTVQAIVHGEDAIQRRLDLERVLDIEGLGDLIHPIYGNIKVKSTTYSVTSRQNDTGRFDFSINFETSKVNITVEPDIVTNSAVSNSAKQARESLNNALEDGYIDPQTVSTRNSLADRFISVLDSVNENISAVVNPIQDNIATFTSVVNEAITEVNTVVSQGVKLKSSLEAVYESALAVVSTPQSLYEAWKDLTGFGSANTIGEINTVYRLNSENDQALMDEHTRITALINIYEATVYSDFQTDEDIDTANAFIDNTFTELMRNYDQVIPQSDQNITESMNILAQNTDVRNSMSELRTITLKVMEQKEKNIWKVVDIDPGFSSMALISYRYYGNLSNIDLIKSLNNDINWSNSDSEIKAVSQ